MRSVVMAIPPARRKELSAEIDQWRADRERVIDTEGWSTSVLETSATSGYDLREQLLALPPFDQLWLVGDLPTLWVTDAPDHHGDNRRPVPADWYLVNRDAGIKNARVTGTDSCALATVLGRPFAGVGRLKFDDLEGLTPAQVTALYRKRFARRHQLAREGMGAYPLPCRLNDHLNYRDPNTGGEYFRYGDSVVAEFARYPDALKRFSPITVNDNDGELGAAVPTLINQINSGGFSWQLLNYWGDWQAVRDHSLVSPIAAVWGSCMCESMGPTSLVRWLLTGDHVEAAIYNQDCLFLFSKLLDGACLGAAALASAIRIGYPWSLLFGDPTLQFDAGTLARLAGKVTEVVEMDPRVDEVLKRLNTLEIAFAAMNANAQTGTGGSGSTDTGTGSGGNDTSGVSVLRRNCCGPAVGDWLADDHFSGGQPWSPNIAIALGGLSNAAPAAIYGSCRAGTSFGYVDSLEPGSYMLRLHFEESANASAGRRLMDIRAQGVLALSRFDIFAAAGGKDRACVRELPVTVGADRKFALAVTASAGSPDPWALLCGYELIKS